MYNTRTQPQLMQQDPHCSPNPKALLITTIILLTTGGIVTFIGLFTPYLVTAEVFVQVVSIGTGHVGIYTECVASGVTIGCGTLLHSDAPEWLKGCQAFGLLGTLSVFVGWIMLLCWLCQTARTKFLKCAIIIIVLLAELFFAAALIFFTVKYDKVWLDYDFTWGFYISWVGVALILSADILFWFCPAGPKYSQIKDRKPIQPTAQQQPHSSHQPQLQPQLHPSNQRQFVYKPQAGFQPQPQPNYRPQPNYSLQPQQAYRPQPQAMQQVNPMALQNQLSGVFVKQGANGYIGYNAGYTAYR